MEAPPRSPAPATEARRLPDWLTLLVIALSAVPGLLILLGVDFGLRVDLGSALYVRVGDGLRLHQELQGSFLHTIMEWTGVSIGVIYAALCLLDYRLRQDRLVLVMGIGLLCAAITDAFHTLAADRLLLHVSQDAQFIPFTWALSRMVNVMVLTFGMSLILFTRTGEVVRDRAFWIFGGIALLISVGASWLSATSTTLPQVQFDETLIKRPYDVLPLVFYGGVLVMLALSLDRRQRNYVTHALLLSLVPATMTQVHMAFGSTRLFDAHFNAGHFLKVLSYLVPLCGLYAEYGRLVRRLQLREVALAEQASVLAHANKRLYREISEREEVEAKLRQQAERLRINNEELEQFAFIASHDLREPLRKILIHTSRLDRNPLINQDSKARELVDSVAASSQRMMVLLESLQRYLMVSGRESGHGEVVLRDLLQEVLNTLAPLVEASGARVRIDPLPVLRDVDAEQMQHLFEHLLKNALTYLTPDGTPDIHISELPAPPAGMVAICVEDNGPGIDPRYQGKVFQIFQRLERDHSGVSTGIGLTLCRRICHRHGGDLRLDSVPGRGSRFIVELPQ